MLNKKIVYTYTHTYTYIYTYMYTHICVYIYNELGSIKDNLYEMRVYVSSVA